MDASEQDYFHRTFHRGSALRANVHKLTHKNEVNAHILD